MIRMVKGGLIAACIGVIFIGVLAFNKQQQQNITKEQVLFGAIVQILESKHFDPQDINDAFSNRVFDDYLKMLNPDKDIFLREDSALLSIYRNKLDDEIKGDPVLFYKKAAMLYFQRLDEIMADYRSILSQPLDFSIDETVNLSDRDKAFAASTIERKDFWRRKLKYSVLERYSDMLEQKQKNIGDTALNKPDEQLQLEARKKVQTMLDRNFNRQKLIFTEQEQFNSFINVIVNLMDPHTEFFPPTEKRGFDEDMSGRFYGIGAQLKDDEGSIKIASLMTGSPAWKSGKISVNDEIIKVAQGNAEPVDIRGYAVTDAVKLIRGSKGTEVSLTMRSPDGATKVVKLIRDEIVQDEQFARSAVIDKDGKKTGYIFLPDFYADYDRPNGNRCSQDVANEVVKLKKENVSGIVIDLRNNGGGSLNEVVLMVGLFIKSGPVVQVADKNASPNILADKDESVLYDGPLTVLVNEFSASASEIFAAAIQDYGRGVIIGSPTYGKGTVQRTLPLGKIDYNTGMPEYGALKITFEKFYRVNGGSTQREGVVPDIILPDPFDHLKFRERDNPTALVWDQIAKAQYTLCKEALLVQQVTKQEVETLSGNSRFALLKENYNWLNQKNDQVYNLQLEAFKKEQAEIRKTIQQNEGLLNLTDPLTIAPTKVDNEKFYNNPDKTKGDRYLDWLKRVQRDIYVDAAVDVTNSLIRTYTASAN
jgi:carboxyl-terminal processing protease